MSNNTTTVTWDKDWVNPVSPDWTEEQIAEAEAAKAKKLAIAKIAAISGVGAGIGVLGIIGAVKAAKKKKGEDVEENVEVLGDDDVEVVNPDGTSATETSANVEDREALAKKIREQAEAKDEDPERDKFIESLREVIDDTLDDELVRTIAEAAWAAGSATAQSKAADDIIAIAAERDKLTNAADAERNAAAEKLSEQTKRADAATARLRAAASENQKLRKDLDELKAAERARAEAEAATAEKSAGDETVKDVKDKADEKPEAKPEEKVDEKIKEAEPTKEAAEEVETPVAADEQGEQDVDPDEDGEEIPLDEKALASIQKAAKKAREKNKKSKKSKKNSKKHK